MWITTTPERFLALL